MDRLRPSRKEVGGTALAIAVGVAVRMATHREAPHESLRPVSTSEIDQSGDAAGTPVDQEIFYHKRPLLEFRLH